MSNTMAFYKLGSKKRLIKIRIIQNVRIDLATNFHFSYKARIQNFRL